MRLLIITQVVDAEDPALGFFVRWIQACAEHFERIEVICLKEGVHDFSSHIQIHSLGKEKGLFRLHRALIFFMHLVRLRNQYDAVFVHMNQEYVLLAGWYWYLRNKPVYLWRNHYAGSWMTDLASIFCKKIFCTSKYSYTAKYKKTVFMPVGVDIDRFQPDTHTTRKPNSVLFLARMSPSKRAEILLEALLLLSRAGTTFTVDFVGSPAERDTAYFEAFKEKSKLLGEKVTFSPAIPNTAAVDIYKTHELFVNTSPSGMLDKTIFEAIASGCIVLASSKDFAQIAGFSYYFETAPELAEHIKRIFNLDNETRTASAKTLYTKVVEAHSLPRLAKRLMEEMHT